MSMNWKKEKPTIEGWYFWRQNYKRTDPFYWSTYFFCDKPDAFGRISWWQNETEVKPPKGGEFYKIEYENYYGSRADMIREHEKILK